jgi:oligopeptide/dipeptide ABC transporter ATP-binding protein
MAESTTPVATQTRPDGQTSGGKPLLSVRDLAVTFGTDDGDVTAVRGVDFDVHAGEVLAVVGESGSGKSVTAMSILGLLPPTAKISGSIDWRGENLLEVDDTRLRAVRGAEIAMIFQDPLTALNPVYRVGDQIVEMIRAHEKVSKHAARARAVEMLDKVGIPQPDKRARQYTHEFSGGMRQRAMIAMALSCNPELIIADEPTTALDVTVQAQVLDLMSGLASEFGTAIILITHDLGVVAGMADKVTVMYGGRMVESGTTDEIFDDTAHPYTHGLLSSLPRLDGDVDAPLVPIGGQPPSMLRPPAGCTFHPRCRWSSETAGCTTVPPATRVVAGTHTSACHVFESLIHEGALSRRPEGGA